jgi:hypothetical protein
MQQLEATIEELCFLRDPRRGVIKRDKEDCLNQLNFEMPACQDISLGAEKLN